MISSRFRVHHEVLSSAGRGGGRAPPARPAAQAALAAHAQLGLSVLRDWERRRLQRQFHTSGRSMRQVTARR